MKRLVLSIGVIVALLTLAGSTLVSAQMTRHLVKIAGPHGPVEQAVVASGGKVTHVYDLLPEWIALEVPEQAVEALRRNPRVISIEADGLVHALGETLPWGVERIDAELVHPYNKGAGIKAAIIDTGIDYNHPDLDANVVAGASYVDYTTDYMDDNGHGTHCAGIVAAEDNDIGVIGVAPEASLYGVKVLDSGGSGYLSDVIAGIDWSVQNGMQVVSMSLGTSTDYQSLHDACDATYVAGSLLVASAGNSGSPPGKGDNIGYPAKYASVIAVAATDQSDKRARWSSTGPDLELAAPGVSIYSTLPDGGYGEKSGTSMACPHVTGTAALVMVSEPTFTNVEVRQRLQATADDLGDPGWDTLYGYGLVDADEAAPPPTVPNTPPVADADGPYTGTEDVAITFDGSASHDPDGDPLTYKWDFGDGTQATVTTPTTTHTYTTGQAGVEKIYTATLIVNDGKVDSDPSTTTAIVTGVNDAPIADAGGPYSGIVNEAITFDGSGSSDEEGTIASYKWDFGDGTVETVTTTTATHTYAATATYTVTLTVTDGDGATNADTTTAEVTEAPTYPTMHVGDIAMSSESSARGRNTFWRITAIVSIVDSLGTSGVKEATVYGTWSGAYSDSVLGTTNGEGKVTFRTDWVKGNGTVTFAFTVDDVVKDGWTYDPTANAETSDSITVSSQAGFFLAQNTPNPFNPETWIPFGLAEPAHVVIKIYNVTGQLVRTLDLGSKQAGAHVSRDKAAYWDGRNANGESVSSGIYFYLMEAGHFRAMKKMLVAK